MKDTMTKNQFRFAMIVGWMLGMMALVIFSFYKFETQITYNKNLDAKIKQDLIKSAKNICNPVYPVVHVTIKDGTIITECRTQ